MLQQLLNIAKRNKWVIFKRPYELNIWGVRSENTQAGKFDDLIVVFWKDERLNWQLKKYQATTDPGTYWLKNAISAEAEALGSAILKEGQYLHSFQRRYTARLPYPYELVQIKPLTIFRDYNRDAILDFYNGRETTGLYGINIHVGARKDQKSIDIGQWSAGCQVFASYNDFAEFDLLCQKHQGLYGDIFSYTLIDERARKRARRRLLLKGLGFGILGGLALYGIYKLGEKQ